MQLKFPLQLQPSAAVIQLKAIAYTLHCRDIVSLHVWSKQRRCMCGCVHISTLALLLQPSAAVTPLRYQVQAYHITCMLQIDQ
jgi:hypothetical protein